MALKTHRYRYFKDGTAQSTWNSSNQLFVGKDAGGNYVMELSFELSSPATSVSITILAAGQNEATQYGYKYKLSTVETDSELVNATSSTDGDGPFTLSSGTTGTGTLTVNGNFKANTPYYVYIFTGYAGVYNKSAIGGQNTAYSPTDTASYSLTFEAGSGTRVWARRVSSVFADVRDFTTAGPHIIYPQDRITAYAEGLTGYELTSLTINGMPDISGSTHTVTSNLVFAATAKRQGLIYLDTGSAMVPCQCYLDTGTEWALCLPYLDTGTDWALLA